ncbi:MAG: hypothetical protein RRZ38_00265 [Hafnia sp.]
MKDAKQRFEELNGMRISWPFKDMAVGDVVVIKKELAHLAVGAFKAVGGYKGFKFSRRKDRDTGELYVKRVS